MTGRVRDYFEAHGFTPALADVYGVRNTSWPWLRYRCFDTGGEFTRSRDLNDKRKRTRQPKGRRLRVSWLHRPPERAAELLLCEGEPDTLAALQAKHTPPGEVSAARVLKLGIAFLPGTATPTARVLEEIERLTPETIFLGFDDDHAGDAAAERLFAQAPPSVNLRRVPMPDGCKDLAEAMAAATGNRADALFDLLDAA